MTTALTRAIARLLFLPTFMVAAAVLVKSYTATGDGFAAGVIAATGVLLQYLALGRHEAERLLSPRLAETLAFFGLLLVLVLTFIPTLVGKPLLSHWPPPDAHVVHLGTLELHTAVLFDLGVFCLVFGGIVGTLGLLARAIQRAQS